MKDYKFFQFYFRNDTTYLTVLEVIFATKPPGFKLNIGFLYFPFGFNGVTTLNFSDPWLVQPSEGGVRGELF
jgi:hypothetical protein